MVVDVGVDVVLLEGLPRGLLVGVVGVVGFFVEEGVGCCFEDVGEVIGVLRLPLLLEVVVVVVDVREGVVTFKLRRVVYLDGLLFDDLEASVLPEDAVVAVAVVENISAALLFAV